MPQRENWIWIILLVYAAGFLAFPPRVLLINDEERYVTQAVAFARGALNVPGTIDPRSGRVPRVASDYPPGTSLLQTPFVKIGGWRAAAALSVIALALMAIFTRSLLREFARPQSFVLLIPAYAGALFFGRVAMSDVPTGALVALSLLLLVKAERGGWKEHFVAGFTAGVCLLFREPVILLLVPFLLGLVRHTGHAAAMVLGGALAVAVRGVVSLALFGDALYVRDAVYGFSLESLGWNLALYGIILLVLFPLGALLPLLYQGPRRTRVVAAFTAYTLLFLAFEYNAWRDNGLAKGTLLAARYMIPALPLLVVMAADVYPRLASAFSTNHFRAGHVLVNAAWAAVTILAFIIHPMVRRWDASQYSIATVVQTHTPSGVPVIFNEKAAGKYLSPVYASRIQVARSGTSAAELRGICRRYGGLALVLLDRTDTELFQSDARDNAEFLSAAASVVNLTEVHSEHFGADLRLRILRASGCDPV